MIRGIYYHELARAAGRQVVLHPLRRHLLSAHPDNELQAIEIPAVSLNMVAIISGVVHQSRTARERIEAWADCVLKCRNIAPRYASAYRDRVGDEAIDLAVLATRDAGLASKLVTLRQALKAGEIVLAAGVMLVVDPFVPLLGTIAAGRASLKLSALGSKPLTDRVERSKWAIRRLALSGPGRLLTAATR